MPKLKFFLIGPAVGNGIPLLLTLIKHNFGPEDAALLYIVALYCSAAGLVSLVGFLDKRILLNEALIGSALQAVFLLVIFAGFYRDIGLMNGSIEVKPSLGTSIYFSIVTWTTLGYGDFHPPEILQMVAAIEALVGYVFSGILIGSLVAKFDRAGFSGTI